MIDENLLAMLVCPTCKQPLYEKDNKLICNSCKLSYPIIDGIPVLLITEAQKENN